MSDDVKEAVEHFNRIEKHMAQFSLETIEKMHAEMLAEHERYDKRCDALAKVFVKPGSSIQIKKPPRYEARS